MNLEIVSNQFTENRRFTVSPDKIIGLLIFFLFFFEAIGGLLRYYLDSLSLAGLIYFPKMIAFILIMISIPFIKLRYSKVCLLSLFAWYCLYGIIHSTILQVSFGIYTLSPFFAGYILSKYIKQTDINNIFYFVFLVSVVGVFSDSVFDVPWKGYSYSVLGQELEANRQWSTFGIDRIAGFSRHSATTAIILGISSVFFINMLKHKCTKFVITCLAFASILLTTNKASIAAFLLIIPFLLTIEKKVFLLTGIIVSFSLGIFIPFFSLANTTTVLGCNSSFEILLASFLDRLENTWPLFFNQALLADNTGGNLTWFFGLGIGSVGSAAKYFGNQTLGVADNMWLYLFGTCGILGFIVVMYYMFLLSRVHQDELNNWKSFIISMNFIFLVGITTDIFESLLAVFIIGFLLAELETSEQPQTSSIWVYFVFSNRRDNYLYKHLKVILT